MEYKDFIKSGERVVYMLPEHEWRWNHPLVWDDIENFIVKIGEYSPYYTDGDLSDPTPEEYNEYCWVEAYPEEKKVDEYQFRLADLHPIQKTDEEISVIYDCKKWKLVGNVLSQEWSTNKNGFMVCSWEENGYAVLENPDGEWKVVSEDDFAIERDISDLSNEELQELRKEFCGGSIYISDYGNSFGIDPDYLCDLYDDFWSYLCDNFGEENAEEHDTPEEFAYFVAA